jgi:signal transduction histidine kinase
MVSVRLPNSIALRFGLWAGAALIVGTLASAYLGARQEERALLTQVERHAGQGMSSETARDAVSAAWRRLVVREGVELLLLLGVLAYLVRRLVSKPFADLAQRMEDTAARNTDLDSFVYSVAHDLKAPLLTIRGFAGLLRDQCGPQVDAAGHHCIERLEANVGKMEVLIADLLAFARVGREAQAPEAVNLAELIDDLRVELRGLIDARGAKITVREVGTLWGVRSQIEHVFRNLVTNAIKYAREGEAPVVEIGMRRRGEGWECSVRDNGIGIDPAYHDKIFEIFQRLQDSEVEGTGVGLALVKKVVDRAGGRIWVASRPGEGATFSFSWPKGGDETD